jgi:hypothetical protein
VTVLASWMWPRGGRRGILSGMPPAVPAPSGSPGARPAYWFPLALFGVIVALPVPLYVMQLSTSPAFSGWVAYAPLSRTVSWSSAQADYSSSFSVLLQSDTGLTGIAEGWYWAAALTAGFLVTAVWYHRISRPGPGWVYLVIALLLTTAVTMVPLLAAARAPLPRWLWLSSEWSRGTFALLVIALALAGLARNARSRLLAIAALAYTAAVLAADGPELRSAPPALIASGGDPLRTLVQTGPQTQPWGVALLPGLVLLVAAALCFARLPRLRGQLRAG